jgi:hypothetical protein
MQWDRLPIGTQGVNEVRGKSSEHIVEMLDLVIVEASCASLISKDLE